MSHFIVVVIGDNVDEQLAPYDENMRVDEYSRGIVPENELNSFIDYYQKDNPDETNGLGLDDLYKKFGKNWNGNSWRKNADGVYEEFTTYNPKSKWDWYQVGGRWTGYFKLKPGAKIVTGQPGVFGHRSFKGMGDVVYKGEIDFDAMRNEKGDTAAKKYDIVFEAIKDTPVNESWETVCAQIKDIDEARDFYWKQPRVNAFKSVTESTEGRELFGWLENIDDYNVDRETFIQQAKNEAISPFAIVKDGEWYQKGKMGWWGMSRDEMTQEEWNFKVNELFDSVPDDTLFTAVDCHI